MIRDSPTRFSVMVSGVGGLLATEVDGTWYFPLCDANGNVAAYVSETGEVVASYTYDAFGRTIAKSGTMADTFPFRFSTKYYDAEADLYYYGYRYYSPELGRWLTRDPIEEDGGDNLYAFCGNNGVCKVDSMGNASDALGVGMGLGFRIGFNSMGRPMYALMLMASAQQGLCDRLRFKTDIGIRFFRGGAIGTPRNSSSWFYETYYSVSGSIGGGKRGPTPFFMNGLQWGSLLGDTYESSFSIGQTFYYNSALDENLVRMGLLRFRTSGFFLNYHNDQKGFPVGFGDGGDRGWTGGGTLGVSVGSGDSAVLSFDDFTGSAYKTIPYNPNNPNRQTDYSESLNQAQWTIGVADAMGSSWGVSIDASDKLNIQHWIHQLPNEIESGYFSYPKDIRLFVHTSGVIMPMKQ